jgi:hypothetical protein
LILYKGGFQSNRNMLNATKLYLKMVNMVNFILYGVLFSPQLRIKKLTESNTTNACIMFIHKIVLQRHFFKKRDYNIKIICEGLLLGRRK